MKKKPGAGRTDRTPGFWLLMAGSSVVASGLAFFWYISPVALGFSNWPEDTARRRLILRLYDVSWHWGIPALLVAQALALALAWRGRRLAAELVALLANLGFALLIATIISLLA